jgi:hypothetical protein
LRKPQFGSYEVERRRVAGQRGLFEYRINTREAPQYAHGKTRSENAGAP